jgi:membrane protein DedA with SNARE-associated domain
MGMDFYSFQQVFNWVVSHSYFFIFLVMCVEGPITTAVAGFAAALGFLNPWAVLTISILGDLVPDAVYYLIGYVGRLTTIKKIEYRFGSNQPRMIQLEELLKRNFGKTIIALKFTPLVTVPGFILTGYLRLPFRKFMNLCGLITIPKAVIFLLVGYFFGQFYNINQYIHNISIGLPLLVLVSFVLYFGYVKVQKLITNKLKGDQ